MLFQFVVRTWVSDLSEESKDDRKSHFAGVEPANKLTHHVKSNDSLCVCSLALFLAVFREIWMAPIKVKFCHTARVSIFRADFHPLGNAQSAQRTLVKTVEAVDGLA